MLEHKSVGKIMLQNQIQISDYDFIYILYKQVLISEIIYKQFNQLKNTFVLFRLLSILFTHVDSSKHHVDYIIVAFLTSMEFISF